MAQPGSPSIGDEYLSLPTNLQVPHMDFIYRMVAEMAETDQVVGAPYGGLQTRMIMPIYGGLCKGPGISGKLVHMSGADWGIMIPKANVCESKLPYYAAPDDFKFMRLDARYTVETDDGVLIYVKSKGIFSGGPQEPPTIDPSAAPPTDMTQDQVEWFTRLQFEAPVGPYHWMNSIMAIGVLAMSEKRIVIDAYRVTNFPGIPARDVNVS